MTGVRIRGVSAAERHLDWEGCFNARDLGGLPTRDGRVTRRGALVRSDALDGLTAAGWNALLSHGIRTVVDLRDPDERDKDAAPRPAAITTVHVPLDASEDRDFWSVWRSGPQFATPLYYRPHLERFQERSAAAVAAIARAAAGGVALHCASGRDRAGQVTLLVLALAGVTPEAIAADYALSAERLPARYAARGEPDQGPLVDAFLADRGTTGAELVRDLAAALDAEAALRPGGLTGADVTALRRRLLGAA
jgi:protein tyrosine/serine phosphatase